MELLYTNTDQDTSFLFLTKLGIVLNTKKKALSGIPQMEVNKTEDKISITIGTSKKTKVSSFNSGTHAHLAISQNISSATQQLNKNKPES